MGMGTKDGMELKFVGGCAKSNRKDRVDVNRAEACWGFPCLF